MDEDVLRAAGSNGSGGEVRAVAALLRQSWHWMWIGGQGCVSCRYVLRRELMELSFIVALHTTTAQCASQSSACSWALSPSFRR